MKRIAITGIMIFLVMLLVTCDTGFSKADEPVEPGYTDVVYSEDGSTITLYLDGVGVPKTQAQRAITRDLAKMSYDYFEVIFLATDAIPPVIARAQWELGQSAGISGVYRGASPAMGHDYLWEEGLDNSNNVALIFVGRKDDKTLLGIGRIAEVDHSLLLDAAEVAEIGYDPLNNGTYSAAWSQDLDADGLPKTPFAFIRPSSTSVTFYVEAVKTGLLVDEEVLGYDNIKTDSFNFTGDGDPTSTGWASRTGHSKRQAPASGSSALYPIYYLPKEKGSVQLAEYKFQGGAETFRGEIMYNYAPVVEVGPSDLKGGRGIAIERRFPRYLEGGRYKVLRANTDSETTVELDVTHSEYNTAIAANTAFNPVVPLRFDILGLDQSVFSFYLDIPVYMITKVKGTNSGELQPIIWKLRTGLASELYSIDSGKTSGGCVLMGIGEIDLDWLEIYWEWLD